MCPDVRTGGAPYVPTFTPPVGVGDANVEGVATDLVRQDHVHQRSVSRVGTFNVAASNSDNPTLADLPYRADGVADEVEINLAISNLPV